MYFLQTEKSELELQDIQDTSVLTNLLVALRREANMLQLSGIRKRMRVHDRSSTAQVCRPYPMGYADTLTEKDHPKPGSLV